MATEFFKTEVTNTDSDTSLTHDNPSLCNEEFTGVVTATRENGISVFRHVFSEDTTIDSNTVLRFKVKGHRFDSKVSETATISKSIYSKNDEMYIITRVASDVCRIEFILDAETYNMFASYENLAEKVRMIGNFFDLPDELQNEIKINSRFKNYPVVRTGRKPKIKASQLRVKFNLCKAAYTPQQQMDIEGIFEDLENFSSSEKNRCERRLSYILNINQHSSANITLTREEIIAELDKYIYKQDRVKEKLAQAIVASKYKKVKGFSVLLLGNPGVGKTAIMKAIAKVMDRQFFVIPLGSATSMLDVLGDAPQYSASDSGEVVKAFYKAGTTNIVMALDEYDKSYESAKEGGKVSKAFNDAISDEHYFKDAFLGTYINTENTIFIATANSASNIPANLLNRFTVINVDDYTPDDLLHIARNYIIPEAVAELGIESGIINIDDSVIKHIAECYCEDDGARDLKKHIDSIVSRVLSIWDSTGASNDIVIDKKFVEATLDTYVDSNSPILVYRRNKTYYSPRVDAEINNTMAKLRIEDLDAHLRDKYEKKLRYLVHAIPAGNAFSKYDKDEFFSVMNSTHYGLEDVKMQIAQSFRIASLNNKLLTSNRYLFVGPPGIGKSSIVKSIAKATGAEYAKISLNGVTNEEVIKGHSFSYTGADAGAIIKAFYKIHTTKGIIHLDEIDKMGTNGTSSVANTLIDLLDDSAEFTDNFIGVPVNLGSTMFIATANDISAVDKILLDRFNIIYLDGYTEAEKEHIITDYVVPSVIKEYCPDSIAFSFSDEALDLLSKVYCRSFGVRDADKAVRKVIGHKLYSNTEGEITVSAQDVEDALGKPPAVRGNFPEQVYPGLSKALAVTSNNSGMAFAVETMLIPNEESLTITGLPGSSTVDSVKLAVSYVKRNYPGKLSNKGIHVHFGEGAVEKDGPSAGVAILMSVISAAFNTSIKENVAYTGEINGNGYVFNIGGTISKIQAAEQSGCTKVFIPYGNYIKLEKEELSQFSIEIVPVRHVAEVIDAIFPTLPMLKEIA